MSRTGYSCPKPSTQNMYWTRYYRSASPTISMRTVSEFGEPDNKGHAKLKHKSEHSMMGQIQTVMGSVIGKH